MERHDNLYVADGQYYASYSITNDTGLVYKSSVSTAASCVHGLAIDSSTKFIYSADDDGNAIWVHSFDQANGTVKEVQYLAAPTDADPRHLVVHPNGQYAYVVFEAGNALAVYTRDDSTGKLTYTNTTYPLIPSSTTGFIEVWALKINGTNATVDTVTPGVVAHLELDEEFANMAQSRLTFCLIRLLLTKAIRSSNEPEETATCLVLQNDRLLAAVNKSSGAIDVLTLDGQNLLGSQNYVAPTPGGSTGSGNNGIGPYLDCYCIPSGFYTPGSIDPTYQLIKGIDASNIAYGGIVLSEVYPPTGQKLQQYWFLRDGEIGLHTFNRLAYYNETTPFLQNLQEFRTLFRPNTPLWTHLITNANFYSPAPIPDPASTGTGIATTVQDATWYLGNRTNDPYVQQLSSYFTKYTFQDTWRDHCVHGMFADGTESNDNGIFGAWMVMNTKDTYFGGPIHSDLVVDGFVYNYIVSNHHGDGTPNITNGFDRTFGPQYYYFNKGPHGSSWESLHQDATTYANPDFAGSFYDSIAKHVPNYIPTSGRGIWKAHVNLPYGAKDPIAVLAQNGVDFQDNVLDTKAYQYWSDIDPTSGYVQISRVKAGTYRLTIYADGIFGQYEHDNIVIHAGKTTDSTSNIHWTPESAGTELFRIGTPDKSSGEFRHGNTPDQTHPLHLPEYRIYWAVYDYPTDFPNGTRYHVGRSNDSRDFNYVHWSVFGGYANSLRPTTYYSNGDVNNWTIIFDVHRDQLKDTQQATFAIQLAGAKTAAGNTDTVNATQK
ncbi:putative rhamnogalacturonan lyase [Phaeomoniella chlamydospora]|uniref:Putative rhamnogalacturonan lyase n=1 Tax=Phaeomoniella chlamydospora TaxID=158046 RepID=A0A0G2EAH3_PHACM|nr:putative rhamnogalacturonan lyase [Phaeomoniella chlamydospora]